MPVSHTPTTRSGLANVSILASLKRLIPRRGSSNLATVTDVTINIGILVLSETLQHRLKCILIDAFVTKACRIGILIHKNHAQSSYTLATLLKLPQLTVAFYITLFLLAKKNNQ